MKTLFLVLSFILSFNARANTITSVFKANSIVPIELQDAILKEMIKSCPKYVSDYGLEELASVQQGSNYISSFSSFNYSIDGIHPTISQIEVLSSKLADKSNVLSITVDGYACD